MKNLFAFLGVIFTILFLYIGLLNSQEVKRLWHLSKLFEEGLEEDKGIVENFRHMDKFFAGTTIKASANPSPLINNQQAPIDLPEHFIFENTEISRDYFFNMSNTSSMLVLHKGEIVLEEYYRGHAESDRHIAWSISKSIISALIGIAIADEKIGSVEDKASHYVDQLKTSGYKDVSLKNLLQMSSGIAYNKDANDMFSDSNTFSMTLAMGWSYNEFALKLKNEVPPGTYNKYINANTQVLGMVLASVYQQPLSQILKEKLWDPIGMEEDAFWITDNQGMELALGGLNLSARDYARFGQLYLNNGQAQGKQILPAQWIKDSVTPDAPHLLPGENPNSESSWGYAYHWWIDENSKGDYVAIGAYNQYVYVDPNREIVIVKLSANPSYADNDFLSDDQSMALFRTISSQFISTNEIIDN